MSVSCTTDLSFKKFDSILAVGDESKKWSGHHLAGLKQNDNGSEDKR